VTSVNAARPAPSTSTHRRRRIAVLTLGALVSLALWYASTWVPLLALAAVVVALLAGVLAVWVALVELAAYRATAAREAADERAAHRTKIQSLHEAQRGVLATVDAHTQALRASLDSTTVELGETRQEASRLRGDNEALRLENADLREENTDLREENTDLRARLGQDASADVVTLPRRRASVAAGPERDDDEPSTVINLDLQRLVSPFVADVQRRHAN